MVLTEHRQQIQTTPIQTTVPAAVQMRAWVASERGQQLWQATGAIFSIDQVCYALDNAHAQVYGLLITKQFFTIISTCPRQAFTRLADRYRAAACAGLCFWWEDSTLQHYEQSIAFFARLRMLPPPR